MSFDEIAAKLDAADMVWSPVQTPAQVAADPQVMACGAIVQVEDGQGGTFPSPASPAPISRRSMRPCDLARRTLVSTPVRYWPRSDIQQDEIAAIFTQPKPAA